MNMEAKYSHMNGEEYLLIHRPDLWREVREIIAEVDAESGKTKVSREKTMRGRMLYSPQDMNAAFKAGFEKRGWRERRATFWVTDNATILRKTHHLPEPEQKRAIEESGHLPIMRYNQTDFLKERVAVEVQLGKYAFVAHDLFVKHLSFLSVTSSTWASSCCR